MQVERDFASTTCTVCSIEIYFVATSGFVCVCVCVYMYMCVCEREEKRKRKEGMVEVSAVAVAGVFRAWLVSHLT